MPVLVGHTADGHIPCVIRDALPTDRAYIDQTFARSFRDSPTVRGAEPHVWQAEVQRMVPAWQSEGARVVVFAADEDPDAILGWAVGTSEVLHYVYVRHDFRAGGVAKQLVAELGAPRCYSLKPSNPRVRVPAGWRFTPRLTMGAAR